jgi:hypothetical protein
LVKGDGAGQKHTPDEEYQGPKKIETVPDAGQDLEEALPNALDRDKRTK